MCPLWCAFIFGIKVLVTPSIKSHCWSAVLYLFVVFARRIPACETHTAINNTINNFQRHYCMYTLRFYSCDHCSLPEGLPSSSSNWLLTLMRGHTFGIVQQYQSTASVSLSKELFNNYVLLIASNLYDGMPYRSLSMVFCVLSDHNNECVVFSVTCKF